jgi:hypothetical protein
VEVLLEIGQGKTGQAIPGQALTLAALAFLDTFVVQWLIVARCRAAGGLCWTASFWIEASESETVCGAVCI